MKNLLLIIITTLCIHTLPAQDTAQWQWAVRMGGFFGDPQANAVDDVPTDMAVDSAGNVYVTGWTMTPVIANDSSIGSNRKVDGYLISYDCQGNFRWMELFGSHGRDRKPYAPDLTIDQHQNIYLSGQLLNKESTKASIGDTSFTGLFIGSLFIAKYSNEGSFKWVNKGNELFDGNVPLANGSNGLFLENFEDKLISLFWSDSVEIFPGYHLNGGTYLGVFDTMKGSVTDIKKLSSNHSYNGFSLDGMAVDSEGNVVVGFNIGDTVEIGGEMFYPDPTMISVVKFNPQGDMLWHFDVHQQEELPNAVVLSDLAIGLNDAVYFGGRTIEGEVFGNDTIAEVIVSFDASLEYMVKLSADGTYNWVRYPDKTNTNVFLGIGTDNSDRVSGTGYMAGMSEYGNTKIEQGQDGGLQDPYYVTYNTDGTFEDAQVLNGFNGDRDRGLTLAYDAVNNLYIGGAFNDDMIIGTDTLDNEGGLSDVFIAKYGTAQCVDTSDTDTSDPTGLQHISSTAPDLRLMPNPAATSTTVTLVAPQDQLTQQPTLTVYDLSGRAVRIRLHPRMAVDAGNGNMAVAWRLDVSGLESGVYVVTSGNGEWEVSEKLMVE